MYLLPPSRGDHGAEIERASKTTLLNRMVVCGEALSILGADTKRSHRPGERGHPCSRDVRESTNGGVRPRPSIITAAAPTSPGRKVLVSRDRL